MTPGCGTANFLNRTPSIEWTGYSDTPHTFLRSHELAHATIRNFLVRAAAVSFFSLSVYGEDTPALAPNASADVSATHDAIRTLRDTLFEATNKKDSETLISLVHADVVLTAQAGGKRVSVQKRDGAGDDLQKLLTGPDASMRSMTVKPDTRWSTTLVLAEGKWQIVNLHVSSNLFDNPNARAASVLRDRSRRAGGGTHYRSSDSQKRTDDCILSRQSCCRSQSSSMTIFRTPVS